MKSVISIRLGEVSKMISERDMEIIRFVAKRGSVSLKDLENFIMSKWNVSIKTANRIVNRLAKAGVLRRRRIDKHLWVELHPQFLSFVVEIYSYTLQKRDYRIRYLEDKM